MASQVDGLHFVLFPLMAQGHMIPMVDIARLLAQCGVVVTIVTTPINANRINPIIARATQAGLQIRVLQLEFSLVEEGLSEGCENLDMLPSADLNIKFLVATSMLQKPVEEVFGELKPVPNCIISDSCLPWTKDVAQKFNIPMIIFHGPGCFPLLCLLYTVTSGVLNHIAAESEPFVVPGLPHQIELKRNQVPSLADRKTSPSKDFGRQTEEAAKAAHGVVVNSFEKLEPEYVKEFRKAVGKNVWCIGPVSLCNENIFDKSERGNKASVDKHHCMSWLDSREPSSVVYVCLGSLSRLATAQMIELGLALEASNRPFIWCIRYKTEEFEKWILEEGFEQRIKDRALLIRGWAPQLLILSHQATGGFLTHCGWNSILEGVCYGVPMITWPMFGEQFCNEKFVVQVLGIGVTIGVEVPVLYGEEEKIGELVKKDDIVTAVGKLMDEGPEREERKDRATELGKMAKSAVEEGGSSHLNMKLLIQDIMKQINIRKST